MECYSTIKRDEFESVLVRWVNPEHVMQSESERETQVSYINTYVWNLEKWH